MLECGCRGGHLSSPRERWAWNLPCLLYACSQLHNFPGPAQNKNSLILIQKKKKVSYFPLHSLSLDYSCLLKLSN